MDNRRGSWCPREFKDKSHGSIPPAVSFRMVLYCAFYGKVSRVIGTQPLDRLVRAASINLQLVVA